MGQPVIVESRPVAGSNIGTEAVVRSPPDGHTMLLVAPANAINTTLYNNLNYNFLRDMAPVGGISRVPNVLEVHPSFPAKTVPEFLAYVKANPGKVNYASSGNGSTLHMSGELFNLLTGMTLTHVPYRGSGPALNDMIGGHDQVMFDNIPSSLEHIRSGRLRVLAVTTATRSDLLPGVPSLGEFIPNFESSAWFGISVPKGTSQDIINLLNRALNEGLADPKLKTRFADLSASVIPGSPTDFGKLVADETEKWGKVVRASGAKPD